MGFRVGVVVGLREIERARACVLLVLQRTDLLELLVTTTGVTINLGLG